MSGRVRLAWFGVLVSLAAGLIGGCALVEQGGQPVEQEAVGLVTAVEGTGPANVERFSLRADDGRQLTFEIRPGQLDPTAFPPAHLREHLASGQKVRVTYVAERGALVATDLADAG
jgi:hypothetical protein